jgi:hypothetical protein
VTEQTPQLSPLHERHLAAGAKLADFGGWSMPLEYAGGGVIAEHTAVRQGVGLFDVSHLGTGTVRGPGAADLVNRCLTNDLGRIGPGQAQYTLCCRPDGEEHAGGVVDDLIAYLHAEDDVLLVPNAANSAEVLARLAAAAPAGVTVTDRHTEVAVLALQGPRSAEVLAAVGLPGALDYMAFAGTQGGGDVTVCRTGYTGEHGYELLVAADRAGELWDALPRARPASCGACGRRGGASRGRAWRCWMRRASGSVWSPAARSPRPCGRASPWHCWTPRPTRPPDVNSPSTSGAGPHRSRWSSRRSCPRTCADQALVADSLVGVGGSGSSSATVARKQVSCSHSMRTTTPAIAP